MRSQIRGEKSRERIMECLLANARRYYSPTVREIALYAGASPASVHRHLQVLRDQGRVTGVGRTLRPVAIEDRQS